MHSNVHANNFPPYFHQERFSRSLHLQTVVFGSAAALLGPSWPVISTLDWTATMQAAYSMACYTVCF